MADTDPDSYTVTLLNAPEGTQYSLYVDGQQGSKAGGTTREASHPIKLSKEVKGDGKIKFSVATRTREYQNTYFSVPISLKGKNTTLNMNEYLPSSAPAPAPVEENAPQPGKKLIKNKLQEEVQEAKRESDESVPEETEAKSPILRGPRGRFVSKKLIGNKLREKVQAAKETETPVDTDTEASDNEDGEQSSDLSMSKEDKKSFWDRF